MKKLSVLFITVLTSFFILGGCHDRDHYDSGYNYNAYPDGYYDEGRHHKDRDYNYDYDYDHHHDHKNDRHHDHKHDRD